MNELLQPPDRKPIKIRGARELAERLGFVYDPKTSWGTLRKFVKPEGEGEIVFIADTVYSNPPEGEKKYQNERYTLAVRLNRSGVWQEALPDDLVSELLSEVNIARNEPGDFKKSALKEGGYNQIFERFQEGLSQEGRLTQASLSTLENLRQEYQEGQKFIEGELLPRIQNNFPQYRIDDSYEKTKRLYIHHRDDPNKVTERVIEFRIGEKSINIKVGRSKINDEGMVDAAYFESYGRPIEVTPSDSKRMNWHFNEIDQVFVNLSEVTK